MKPVIKLSILDEKRVVTGNFKRFFQQFPYIQTQVPYNSLQAFLDSPDDPKPDVLLLDEESLHTPTAVAIDKIKGKSKELKVILLTMSRSADYLSHLLTTKADCIVSNSDEIESLLEAIVAVHEGRGRMSFEIERILRNP